MSSSLADLMQEDAAAAADSLAEVNEAGVSKLSQLASELEQTEADIKSLEQDLKDKKAAMYQLSDKDIPSLMQELGVKNLTLENGASVAVTPTYGGHISQSNQDAAFDWLRNNEYDDIIKNVVTLNFGKGEDTKADELYQELVSRGLEPGSKTSVHAQTLKAWIRERIESGDDFPGELFGAHVGQRAKIKAAKKGS